MRNNRRKWKDMFLEVRWWTNHNFCTHHTLSSKCKTLPNQNVDKKKFKAECIDHNISITCKIVKGCVFLSFVERCIRDLHKQCTCIRQMVAEQIHKYKNTNTQIQKYKYTNTNTILVVMMLTNCPSGLDSQKRLSLWVEAGRACVHFTFGTKQGRGEEKARVKTGPKRWVGGQLTRKGKKGRKSHLQPCKEPSGGGQ